MSKSSTTHKQVFRRLLDDLRLPQPVEEHRFHPTRRWRFDLAWPSYKIALEIEGALYGMGKPCPVCKQRRGGAHSAIGNVKRDIEKYGEAAALGWLIVRSTPDDLCRHATVDRVRRAIRTRKGEAA